MQVKWMGQDDEIAAECAEYTTDAAENEKKKKTRIQGLTCKMDSAGGICGDVDEVWWRIISNLGNVLS